MGPFSAGGGEAAACGSLAAGGLVVGQWTAAVEAMEHAGIDCMWMRARMENA